jgi:acetyl-CoA C-acetyltransferase
MGSFQGALSGMKATEPGAVTIRAAVERSDMESSMIDRTYMGCVLPAGFGQAPPRQAAPGVGLSKSVGAAKVNVEAD